MPTASRAGWSGAAEKGRGERLSRQKGSTQWTVTLSWRNQYFLSPWVAPCHDLAVLMFLRQEAELTSGSRRSLRLRMERGGGVRGACSERALGFNVAEASEVGWPRAGWTCESACESVS